MNQCMNLEKCKFFNFVEKTEDMYLQYALKGFIILYCKGAKSSKCVRKKISIELGKDKVPENMMPNGFPLKGTDSSEWPIETKKYVYKWRF